MELKNKNIVFKIAGKGFIELKFFLGDEDPETAIKLYHKYLNKFSLVPFWAMGYQQSKYGYNSSKELLMVLELFHIVNLPIDAIYSDIDLMYPTYANFNVAPNFEKKDIKAIKDHYQVHWVKTLTPINI